MKRVLSFCIALCLVVCLLPAASLPARAADATSGACGTNLTWTLSGGTLTISGTGEMTQYSSYFTVPWYSSRASITAVNISSDVTSIGSFAFWECTSLTSVTIPGSVTSIGDDAFSYCTGLTSVTIPGSVTSIGSFAFRDCIGLTSVTIPGSVTSIGINAFERCVSLTSVTIPSSVTSIGQDAFERCTSLTQITVDAANRKYSSDSHGVLFDKNKATLICAPGAICGAYAIPESVISIDDGAFETCHGLTSVSIPDSVNSIGFGVFYGCSGLTQITVDAANRNYSSDSHGILFDKSKATLICAPGAICGAYAIPDSVTSFSDYAFNDCTGLTSVSIPDSVTYISNSAFRDCIGLTSVTIPGSVTSIGYWAFWDCTGLTSVTIPGSVTSIGSFAFSDCIGLTSVTIPDSVTSIGRGAFEESTGLTSARFIGNAPTTVGSGIFDSCAAGFTIYYPTNATGWSNPWNGYKAAVWQFTQTTPAPDPTPVITNNNYQKTTSSRLFRIRPVGASYPAPAGFSVAVGDSIYKSSAATCFSTDDIKVTVPAGYTGNIIISKDGYYTYSMPESLSGAYNVVTMTPTSVTAPFAQALYVNKGSADYRSNHNLLLDSEMLYAAGLTDDKADGRALYPSINWNGHGDGTVWLQQGDYQVPLTNNVFNTVTFDNHFSANNTVYLCAKASDGTTIKVKTNIDIYERANSGFSFNLGDSLTIPKDKNNKKASILSDDSLNIDFSDLSDVVPISFTVKGDGTVEGVFGLQIAEAKDKQAAFGSVKETVTKLLNPDKTQDTRDIADYIGELKDKGLKPSSMHGSFGVSGDVQILGYFTGNFLDGRFCFTEIKSSILLEGKLSYTYNTVIADIPAYFKVAIKAKVESSLAMKYDTALKEMNPESDVSLDASLSLSAEAGPGWEGYLSGGVKGSGAICVYTTLPIKKSSTQLSLKASLSFVGTLAGLSGEWKFYSTPEMVFWDAGTCTWKEKSSSASLSESFTPDLQSTPMLMDDGTSGSGAIVTGVSGYNQPCLTKLSDGRLLAVWVADVAGRKAVDKNGVYYSVRGTDGAWSIARLVWDDSTNDSVPTLYTAGGDVWVVWQNYTQTFNCDTPDTIGYDTLSAQTDVAAAKFDTGTSTFTGAANITNTGYDYAPQITDQNGTVTMAFTNGNSVYTSSYTTDTWSVPAVQTTVDWYSTEPALPSTYIGTAPSTNSTRQMFSTDTYQAILYTANDANGVSNVFGLFNDGYGWGEPVQLTKLTASDGSVGSFRAVINEGGTTDILATVRHYDTAGNYTSADLYCCSKKLKADLAVSDADYVRDTYVPGSTVTLTASVTNNSAQTVSGVKYSVMNGTAEVTNGTYAITLLPGQTKTVYMNYDMPANFSSNTLNVKVTPNAATDVDESDNSAVCTFKQVDLSVEQVAAVQTISGTQLATQVVNRGQTNTGDFNVTIHRGTPDGTVLSMQTVSSLATGEASNLIVDLQDKLPAGEMVYVEAQKLDGENLYGNNTNQATVVEEIKTGLYSIVKGSYKDGTLTLNVTLNNNSSSGNASSCIVMAAVYDGNGRMLAMRSIDGLSIANLQADGGTLSIPVTTSGTSLTWKVITMDNSSLKPLTDFTAGITAMA